MNAVKRIRWRLLVGVLSLAAAIAVTLPAAASQVDLGRRVADIWPNAQAELADIIWPNAVELDVIWPNAGVIGGQLADTSDSQGNQDVSGNQN